MNYLIIMVALTVGTPAQAFHHYALGKSIKELEHLNKEKPSCLILTGETSTTDHSQAHLYHQQVEMDLNWQAEQGQHQGHSVSVLTKEQAHELFQKFEQIEYMQFEHLEDGCYNRAHEFALIAKQQGITMGKAFVEHRGLNAFYENYQGAGVPSLENNEGRSLLLYPSEAKNKKVSPFSKNFAGWEYHVAPYVLVQENGQLTPYMFDVGISRHPQPLPQWQRSLHQQPTQLAITYTPSHYMDEQGYRTSRQSTIREELEREEHIKRVGAEQYFHSRQDI